MGILRFRSLASPESRFGVSGSQVTAMGSHFNLRRAVGTLNFLHQRSECKDTAASNTCEKPVGSSGETLTIVLGIVIPVTAAIIVLLYLHRRNMRREALEDADDPNQGLDFGLDEPSVKGHARKSLLLGGAAEKGSHKGTQLSMDINLASPYLVPAGAAGAQDSRESIHSLARSLQNEKDPYQQAARYNASDAGSLRSVNRESPFNDPSGDKMRENKAGKNLGPLKMPPRGGPMPRSPVSQHTPYTPGTPRSGIERDDPFASPATPKATHQLSGAAEMHNSPLPVQPIVPEIGVVSPADGFNGDEFEMPDLPPPVASRNSPDGPGQAHPPHNHHAHSDDHDGLGLDLDIPTILAPGALPHELEHGPLYDQHGNQPQMRPARQQPEAHGRDDRGRAPRRPPPPPNGPMKPPGLRVPQQGAKRTSVGHRPLPPNEMMQSDDPETRANRIRSFYKEYFEESKEGAPPVPQVPQVPQNPPRNEPPKQPTSIADYYDDDDDNCLGDAAYYDAETNSFIMPYAQPVTRRAMTPPPASRSREVPTPRGPPRGPGPRGPQGSVSGVSLPGGTRPRAGSAHDLRPGSSASARWNRGPPQKKLPPPSPLNTLPAPSKLADDSFAILGAIEFAPPTSIREHVAGRSQSPMGERRPYNPKIPAASPLNAFDELAVLPSPHMLRKSTAFTALDFAPPKKFKEAENMSETGSISSERSGMSASQLNAIRSGAGRVSRLPGDTVFTQSAMDSQLKPQWGMRQ